MTHQVVVAVTGPRRGAFGPRFLVACAVRWYGARALQVRPGDDLNELQYDAVVVTGGHDIDPVLYAAEPEVVRPQYDAERDALEMAVIDDALARNLPLLGICRGAQLLNAQRGGNLFQDLKSRRKLTSNRRTLFPLKTLCLVPDSQLSRLLGVERAKINSLHNQAIDQVGEGLVITARDLDNITQAIEAPDRRFLMGVQWHPEFLLFIRRQRRLFKALVMAARELQ